MAINSDVNVAPANGSVCIQSLIKVAIASGLYEGHAWGGGLDGSDVARHARSTDFTTGADGILYADALKGKNAWGAIKKVGSTRTLLFAHDTSYTDFSTWKFACAEGGLDADGDHDTYDTPTEGAGDLKDLISLYEAEFPARFPADGTYKWHAVADAAESWAYGVALTSGTGDAQSYFVLEEPQNPWAIDVTPFVAGAHYQSVNEGKVSIIGDPSYSGLHTWVDYAGTGVVPVLTPPKLWCWALPIFAHCAPLGVFPLALPAQGIYPCNDGTTVRPTWYLAYDQTGSKMAMDKGTSRCLFYRTSSAASGVVFRDSGTSKSYLVFGDVCLPWPDGTAIVL